MNTEYLEYELEQLREYQRQTEWEAQQRREDNLREARDMYEYAIRTAADWPEALRKQAALCEREAAIWRQDWTLWHTDEDNVFGDTARACRRALQIWQDMAPAVEDEIAKLERQIAELQYSLRQRVAGRLAAEIQYKSAGWEDVVDILSDPDADPSEWLNW